MPLQMLAKAVFSMLDFMLDICRRFWDNLTWGRFAKNLASCDWSSAMVRKIVLFAYFLSVFPVLAIAHEDEEFHNDRQPPYAGPGYRAAEGGSPPIVFASNGVALQSWIPLVDFNPATTSADDCWGYTSPSGREYALIGLSLGTGIVEVTDPANAQIVTVISGPTSIWRDIKTYQTYAYAVSEGGSGIQVLDLSQIDQGTVTLVNTVLTGPGTSASHNVAINEESGFLYRVGGGSSPIRGIRAYDLADPANPVFVGEWSNRYCHDAQVVNWTSGPFAGRELAICYANDTSGGGNAGIDIIDVSTKNNMFLIGSVNLTQPPIFSHAARFSHQGWLSPDRQTIYFGDEVDEGSFPFPNTTTRVIDVTDISNPTQVATFSNGNTARDHNIYTKDNLIFQANYRSGLRIFDATIPGAPVEIAYFDTYPNSDSANYNGLWNVYPYFPSGTIIGSDIEKGLFVWTLAPVAQPVTPLVAADYPHAAKKNRYISFQPDPSTLGTPHGYQVTHLGTGQSRYISTPRTTPVSIAGNGLTYLVQDSGPPLFDFGALPVLHVGGCMIAPGESYEVRATFDGLTFSAPMAVSTADVPTDGRWWADVTGVFSTAGDGSTNPVTPASAWTPPNGIVNGFDITAIVRGFENINAPHISWVDLDPSLPNRVASGNDVLQAVNAFSLATGSEFYPFDVPSPPGPQGQAPCPAPPLEAQLSP